MGSWIEGEYHGEGTLIDKEAGLRYEGNWVSDEMQGFGVIRYDDGEKYEGNFR